MGGLHVLQHPQAALLPRKPLSFKEDRHRIYTLMLYMEVIMQVAKWGNSLAVRLPVAVVEELGLKEGDDIQITVKAKDKMEVEKKPGVEELLATLNKYSGRVPLSMCSKVF
jgi:antitoxin MazE